MKKVIKRAVMLTIVVFLFACSKDEKSVADQLSELKSVSFPEKPDNVLSEESTGRVVGNKIEYLRTVQRQKTLSPVELITPANLEILYPGSILRGGDFLEGSHNPVVVKNPKEITISTTFQGKDLAVKAKSLATPSDARQSINDLVNKHRENIDYNNTPAYLTYISNEITTTNSFNKTFGIHVKAEVLSGLVSANFNYTETKLNKNSKKYVLIKVRQVFYSVSVDPILANEWGDLHNLGDYEPVYISSVDYGRVAHILVETDESLNETTKTIKAGISAKFPKFGGSVDTTSEQKVSKWFQDKKITVMIAGGPLSQSKMVTDLESFKDFLTMPSAADLVNSATPIGYKVRTLKDNREVEVRTMYTEQEFINK
jgi:flavomodulin